MRASAYACECMSACAHLERADLGAGAAVQVSEQEVGALGQVAGRALLQRVIDDRRIVVGQHRSHPIRLGGYLESDGLTQDPIIIYIPHAATTGRC